MNWLSPAILLLVSTALPTIAADPLTIGTPAPPLDLGTFVKGEPVNQLIKGVVHVVEFSGTECAPCIKCIPHMTELQKKHPKVVFISVYSEKEEPVRRFLAKHGDAVGFRVALDRAGVMEKTWMTAASLSGIPKVFIVGQDGTIAWIGSPFDLADPLQRLLDGKLDTRFDQIRLRFEQADVAVSSAMRNRMTQSNKAQSEIHKLLGLRKWEEGIRAAEQASRDFPEESLTFQLSKLYGLAANPLTVDDAFRFAALLSASRQQSWGENAGHSVDGDARIAEILSSAHRTNNDDLLLKAALWLLRKAEERVAQPENSDEKLLHKLYVAKVFSEVHVQQKDFVAAAARQRERLELARQRRFPANSGRDRESWEREQKELVAHFETLLAEYVKAAEKNK